MDDAVERLLRAAAGIEPRAGVRTCLIGGLARGIWAPRRATADVDVIVDVADPWSLIPVCEQLGLVAVPREVEALRAAAMTRLRLPDELTGDTRLDVIGRSHDYYDRVFARSITVDVLGVAMRVACAEDVIVLKTLAGRPQDRADIGDIVAAQGATLRREIVRDECAALEIDVPPALA